MAVSVYTPEFETQRDQNAPKPWTNCNLAAHAMLVDHWSYGRLLTDDIELRKLSGVDPRFGVNFAACARAIRAKFSLTLRYSDTNAVNNGVAPIAWEDLRKHLQQGGGAVAAGLYSSLSGYLNSRGLALDRWQPGGTFGHAIFFCDEKDDTVLLMDPLGHGDYSGDRVPIAALWAFIWKERFGGRAIVTASYTMAEPRPQAESREARLAKEVVALRVQKPKAADQWVRWTGLTQKLDGKPLQRIVRLAAEKTALTMAPQEV